MKKKKVLTVLASAVLTAATLLTGCGGKSGDASNMSVFMLTMPNVEDLATNDFSKHMEETTGIHMEYLTGTRDDWNQKLTMLLQSDDYPDILLLDPGIPKYGVKEGIIIPLDDYLNEETMPNYMKMMSQFDINVTRETDGKIYSLANINDCFHCKFARKMWVNTEYLKEIDCEIPTTTEEFKEVCRKFLEYKPDGVAVAGASSGWFVSMQDWLLGAYTFIPASSSTFLRKDYVVLDTDTNKVLCAAMTDEYKEGLKFINELYEMGAIDDGAFTKKSEDMKTLVNQADEPVLFFPAGTISDVIDSESNNELYRKYAPMAPIAGPDGTRIAWTMPNYGVSSGGAMITDNCPDVEAALKWLDFFYGETGDLCSQYGAEEGVDWVLYPEGKVGMNGEPAFCEILNSYSGEAQNHDWQDIGIRVAPESYRLGWAVDPNVDPYTADGLEKLLYDASKELYEPYSEYHIVNLNELKVTDEESTDISTVVAEVAKIISESSAAFITGEKNFESDWDSYLKDLESAGVNQLLELYQTAYDRSR